MVVQISVGSTISTTHTQSVHSRRYQTPIVEASIEFASENALNEGQTDTTVQNPRWIGADGRKILHLK